MLLFCKNSEMQYRFVKMRYLHCFLFCKTQENALHQMSAPLTHSLPLPKCIESSAYTIHCHYRRVLGEKNKSTVIFLIGAKMLTSWLALTSTSASMLNITCVTCNFCLLHWVWEAFVWRRPSNALLGVKSP